MPLPTLCTKNNDMKPSFNSMMISYKERIEKNVGRIMVGIVK